MQELEKVLSGDSAAAPPTQILEAVADDLAHREVPGAPHTIYQELWHITLWQQVTLDWVNNIETEFPAQPSAGFPQPRDVEFESWDQLCRRFFEGNRLAASLASEEHKLEQLVRCPSRPGMPVRIMSVREQLESLGAHNAYHFGRIVLLRQLGGSWPPPSGGFSW